VSVNTDQAWIVDRAKDLGFDLCGIVRVDRFPELEKFGEWLKRGYAGEMKYLHDPRRTDPSLAMKNALSAIVCALNYNTAHPYSIKAAGVETEEDDEPRGWISRYAWGDDYHTVMWEKLNRLVEALKEKFPQPFAACAYADTGPIAERVFAKHAGLGWLGKNTLLLNKAYGSWLFLGVILTSLDLAPSLNAAQAPPPDLCGSCRKCLDACPTQALIEPYVLDATRCISYLTIELRGNIPEEFREAIGWQLFGCDICQDVCPYNRKAPVSPLKEFRPRKGTNGTELLWPSLNGIVEMDQAEYRKAFQNSAVKRAKWAGLIRNACIALGNTKAATAKGQNSSEEQLRKLSKSQISTIAESADWALERIQQRRK
jgi:epoxyqueuosine reductase